MQVSRGWQLAGAIALGVGAAVTLGACANRSNVSGPMADLTKDLIDRLKPGSTGPLEVATEGVCEYRDDDGRLRGTMDGTRLLQAADAHAYGTPEVIDVAKDVQGDGRATFNEVREVVRHFDADASLDWSAEEATAFEREVGIRWIPGG